MANDPSQKPDPFVKVDGFKGLNTRIDPTRLGLEWQLQADNVLCDDGNFLTRRPGIATLTTGIKDMYGTRDGRLFLITTGDVLQERLDDGTTATMFTGVTGGPFRWTELGYALFVQSDTNSWAIYPDQVRAWGSLCPTPTTPTYPLGDPISYPPPTGHLLGTFHARLVVGVWEPSLDRSVLYYSRPEFPHEFRLDRDFVVVPGQVTLLVGMDQGLVVGTDRAIYVQSLDLNLKRVAEYGVPLNGWAYDDPGVVFFWSDRGLCKALPFENLTDKTVAPTLRQQTTAGLFPWNGSEYVVVCQTGPTVTKPVTRPYVPVTVATTYAQNITP